MNPARRSALLVWDGSRVKGVILVSQSTYRILRDLYELLVQLFAIFLASLGAAVLLSLLAATTIAGPLERLRRQAGEVLDRRGRLRAYFRVPRRRDEICALASIRGAAELVPQARAPVEQARFLEMTGSNC